MTPVILNRTELRMAVLIGTDREIWAVDHYARPRYGQTKHETLRDNIVGAQGELVVAKLLGVYPATNDGPGYDGDLFPGIEVRATTRPDGCLIVRPDDPPDRPYVLVSGKAPGFSVPGWLLGAEAMHPKYLRDDGIRNPAYFVPASELRPITELAVKK